MIHAIEASTWGGVMLKPCNVVEALVRRTGIALVAIGTMLFATGASAQETAGSYFRQYRDAIAAGDLTTAEAAANNALAASVRRDGQGGDTPALALNLARVRVQLGQWQEARAPAQQAYELSRASTASAVDPLMSELLWGRVRLATEGFEATEFLAGSLDRADSRADLIADRYDAADQLGTWAAETRNFIIARRAWAFAADAAQGAPFDVSFARGRARTYEGIAIAMLSITRDAVMSAMVAREVRERLEEAHSLVRPYAFNAAPDGQLTTPQQVYAQILAWDAAVWSKMATDDESRRDDARLDANLASVGGVSVCAVRRTEGLDPSYSSAQARQEGLGAVIVRLRFGDGGDFLGADIVASVGDNDFPREVAEVVPTWVYSVDAANNCAVLPVVYVQIAFTLR